MNPGTLQPRSATKPEAGPRWNRLDRDERRGQILARAHELFESKNFNSVSMAEIAEAAGVTRGLLNHYFGNKRELYLEVVRQMVWLPGLPVPADSGDLSIADVISDSVGTWLDRVAANRQTWLTALGAEGPGSDPEVELILDEARERVAGKLLLVLGVDAEPADRPELFAVIRSYGAMAEAATAEWLRRGRLDREQVHTLLTTTLMAMVDDVLPKIQTTSTRTNHKESLKPDAD